MHILVTSSIKEQKRRDRAVIVKSGIEITFVVVYCGVAARKYKDVSERKEERLVLPISEAKR